MTIPSLLLALCLTDIILHPTHAYPSLSQLLSLRDNNPDPSNPSWIRNYAAIGDSYPAGIGAGNVLNGDGDVACARYDGAYPVLLNNILGGKSTFQFLACSGDESTHVKDQVTKLADNSQDLVTVSAGGNDVLLSDVLKACVYTPAGQDACDKAIASTQDAVDHKLQSSVDDLLQALAPKMKQGGIVVYSLYGQFFNGDTDACSSQSWDWFQGIIPGNNGVKLSKDLRKKLNGLVVDANTKIKGVIASQSGSTRPSKLNIAIADWDDAVGKNNGRFCEDGSADDPNDPSNAGLIFQRLNSAPQFIPPEKSKKLETSHRLGKRVPDDIARVFHPTELGQQVIATFVLLALMDAKGKDVGGTPPQSCSTPPINPPSCSASSNQGIDKDKFQEARDDWCKDTSKTIDPSKDYSKYFHLEFKKGGGTCPTNDCVDTLNKAWNACAEYASRPDYDDGPLKGHYGPLRGNGQADSQCGTYSFKLEDGPPKESPDCGQKLGQPACAGVYKVHFKQSLGGKDPSPLISYDVTDDVTQKSLGGGFAQTASFLARLGGDDGLQVDSKDPNKKDTALTFQYVNDKSNKKGKVYADSEKDGNMFHCDPPSQSVVDGNPDESRLLDCWFNTNELAGSAT